MGDTTKRDDDLHDEIVRLRELAMKERATVMRQAEELTHLRAAVERVRALHVRYPDAKAPWCRQCHPRFMPCPTLRALEETP